MWFYFLVFKETFLFSRQNQDIMHPIFIWSIVAIKLHLPLKIEIGQSENNNTNINLSITNII